MFAWLLGVVGGAPARALPSGGAVTQGDAQITAAGGALLVVQSTPTAALTWRSFDVGANESVTFVQPSARAVALNRVSAADASRIEGRLSTNGQVFLLNPHGVLFGPGAQVDVGGLVASTLALDGDGAGGDYAFAAARSAGRVVNDGAIRAAPGGYVALLGTQVQNRGRIDAPGGSVLLAAGAAVHLALDATGQLTAEVRAPATGALAANSGRITADGGHILLDARAGSALLDTVVNNSGVIEARTQVQHGGVIELLGGPEGGSVVVGGTLDASAPNGGVGGSIETSGARVQVAPGARITAAAPSGAAGRWLIDPTDFVIADTDPGSGVSYMSPATLESALASNDVTIETAAADHGTDRGDILVQSAVSWSSAHGLTLRAHHDVDINAELHSTGGKIVLRADKDGMGAGTVKLGTSIFSTSDVRIYYNPDDNNKDLLVGDTRRVNPASYTAPGLFNIGGGAVAYMLVNDVYDLQNVANNLSGNYALGRDIDASAARGWNAGQGFDPIGQDFRDSNSAVDFSGAFSGVFDGLGHVISHLRSVGWSLDGIGLFSLTSAGAVVRNVGLDDVTVSGGSTFTGGLVGENYGLIEDAYSRGAVRGSIAVGGLVGGNVGTIVRAYSEGTVSGDSEVGGLVGENSSFFTRPDGTGSYDSSKGEIRNAYANARVTASGVSAGGLVGVNLGTIVGAYSIGAVSGPQFTGGLVGASDGLDSEGGIHHAFWDITTSGATAGTGGGSGAPADITPVQSANPTPAVGEPAYAFDHAAYTGFSFGATPRSGTWFMIDGDTRPMLQAEYSTEIRNAHQLQLMTMAPDAAYTLAADVDLGPDLAPVDGDYPAGLWTSAGFVPVGDSLAPFTGSFDGSGHVIEHLRIDRPRDELGLFGQTGGGATIRRVGLQDVAVSGEDLVGGLVGVNLGTITDAYVDGDVRGDEVVGGLVGRDEVGTIRTSYSAGQVSGASVVGGLVGQLFDGDATAVYSTAAVSGDSYVGGLVGILSDGSIEQSYSSGRVIGESEVGGLVGVGSGVNGSYWDSTSSGQLHARGNGNDAGATELQSTDGKFAKATYAYAAASYPEFDFGTSPGSATWFIVDGYTRPFLQMEYGTVVHNAHQLQLLDMDRSADYTLAQSIDLGPALGPQNGTYPGMWSAAGFAPIGWRSTNPFFFGSLDGGGHLIEHLAINRPDDDSIGLFSMLATEVQRLGLSDVQILGKGAVGALAGTNYGLVRDVYATGSVHGDGTVGGLVGVDDGGGQLLDTYSAATVRSRHTPPGGLVGAEFVGRVSAGFWDTDSSGVRAGSGPGSGLGTAQMKQAATFRSAGWDFNGTWAIKEGFSYPYFQTAFPDGVSVVSGHVAGVSGGDDDLSVAAAVNGVPRDTTHSGANGSFYFAFDPFAAGDVVRVQLSGTRYGSATPVSTKSNALWGDAAGGDDAAALQLAPERLAVYTGLETQSATVADVVQRATGAPDDRLLYTAAGQLDLAPGAGLLLDARGPDGYTLDQDLTADGPLEVWAERQQLNVAAGVSLHSGAAGDAVVLATGGAFSNAAGSGAIDLGNPAGRWLLYAPNPDPVTLGGLSYAFKQYDAQYAPDARTAGAQTDGAGLLYALQPVLSVTLTGPVQKTYDGSLLATIDDTALVVGGALSGDDVTVVHTAATYADADVGAGKLVTVSGLNIGQSVDESGATVYGYRLDPTASAPIGEITAKSLSVSGLAARDKVYDGTTRAVLVFAAAQLQGIVSLDGHNDDVALSTGYEADFADVGVGTGKPVRVSGLALTGADARNYVLQQPQGLTAAILSTLEVPAPRLDDDYWAAIWTIDHTNGGGLW